MPLLTMPEARPLGVSDDQAGQAMAACQQSLPHLQSSAERPLAAQRCSESSSSSLACLAIQATSPAEVLVVQGPCQLQRQALPSSL